MLKELFKRYPCLEACKEDIEKATETIIKCYENGGKLLLCGNGGSAADCEHITGELLKGFLSRRPLLEEFKAELLKNEGRISDEALTKLQMGLPAVNLSSLPSLSTAFMNDVDPFFGFAQATLALGKKGDVLIAMSTSGNAENVYNASLIARGLGLPVIGLTGDKGGKLREVADVTIKVPETETFKVQELHLPVYHYLCAAVEKHFFG